MSNSNTKFMVGLFVAFGTAIALFVVIWLGMSNFFNKGQHFAVYFDESVQGLSVDVPVRYRGVAIGRVVGIKVAADSHLIEIVLELTNNFKVEDSMAAQLKVVGITGNMFIELDHLPESKKSASPKLNFPTEYRVIASRPSDINLLFQGIDEIVHKINSIDLAGLGRDLQQTLASFDQSLNDADVAGLSRRVKRSFDNIDQTVTQANLPAMINRVNSLLAQVEKSAQDIDVAGISKEAQTALKALTNEYETLLRTAQPLIRQTTATVNTAGDGIVNLNQQMIIASRELTRATTGLNDLLERLNDHPSQLIFSEPPPRRITEEGH